MNRSGVRPALSDRFRHALVTGGAGFVGSHLCRLLLESGVRVTCLDNFLTGDSKNVADLSGNSLFELVEADVSETLPALKPLDLVLHLASPASPLDYLRHPVETLRAGSHGTYQALCLARENSARFVMASTSEVYGDPLRHPQREDYWGNVNPVGPRSVYDEAKRFSEAMTTAFGQTHGVDTGIVRIFNTYGPGMRRNDGRAVPTFIDQALSGHPLTVAGDGSQTRSLCYVQDTVRGMVEVALSDCATPVNIGNPDEITILDLAQRIRDITGSSSKIRYVPSPADDPQRRRPDIGKAWEVLGWKPETPLTEGLKRTISWFASEPGHTSHHRPSEEAGAPE